MKETNSEEYSILNEHQKKEAEENDEEKKPARFPLCYCTLLNLICIG